MFLHPGGQSTDSGARMGCLFYHLSLSPACGWFLSGGLLFLTLSVSWPTSSVVTSAGQFLFRLLIARWHISLAHVPFSRFFSPLQPHWRNRRSAVEWPCSTASYCAPPWFSPPCMPLFNASVAPCLHRSKTSSTSTEYCSGVSYEHVHTKHRQAWYRLCCVHILARRYKGSGKSNDTSLFASQPCLSS